MQVVQPRLILLEGMKDKQFQQHYATGTATRLIEPVRTMYRGAEVRVLDAALMYITCLERQVPVVSLGHPSHFGRMPIWGAKVVPTVRQIFKDYAIKVQNPN